MRRYNPAKCIGTDMNVVNGNPDPQHVSTSFVGRQKSNDAYEYAPLHALDGWAL
jgi:hypothetical protein